MSSGNHPASYKISSVTPERLLKTQISEIKATFLVKKIFWPFLSRVVENDKRQRTNKMGPEGFLTTIVQVRRSFL